MAAVLARLAHQFPPIVSVAVLIALLCWGLWSNWIQYKSTCEHGTCMFHIGESFTSITTAIFYQRYGGEYWFLQQVPQSGSPDWVDRDFMLYSHNPNIGGFVVYAATLVGFQTVIIPAIVTAIAYAIGIYLSFRFGEAATGSRLIGSWYGLFMATDVFYNVSWGLNLIRGWSWLGLFGVWYATLRLTSCGGAWSVALLVVGSAVTFLVGLDFTMLVAASAVVLALMMGETWRTRVRVALLIIGAFGALLCLRQIQIIGALGVEAWSTDIFYTASLKLPRELRWYEIPDDAAIQGWYVSHNLTRGHAAVFSIRAIDKWVFFLALLNTWKHLSLSLPIFILGALSTMVLVAMRRRVDARGLAVLFALLVGTALSGTVIFPQFTGYFVKLGFPYLSAIIYLALAIAVGSILRLSCAASGRLVVPVMAVVLVVWAVQQVMNVGAAAPEAYPHLLRVVPYGFWLCPGTGTGLIACS